MHLRAHRPVSTPSAAVGIAEQRRRPGFATISVPIGPCPVRAAGLTTTAARSAFAALPGARSTRPWCGLFVRYSSDYVAIEREARAAKRGVFVAENMPPWEFRAEKWDAAPKPAQAGEKPACPIKGNISASGERIYHMPWQRDYARVAVSEAKGERWFCDEGQAERAGWRKAAR